MGIERVLEEARETVKKTIPSNVEVTDIDFEGPVIVIYTKNLDEFAKNNDLVRQLAQSLRRRVAIRPDPSMLADSESAEERIRKIIPEEAKITNIYFEDDTGEVTIEAISPGLVIGKHGAILNEIKKDIGWAPKVVRAAPIPSKTVSEIRNYLRKVQDERKDFLRKVGRRLMRQRMNDETWLRVTALGGYREVGRSATLLSTRESKVLIDCGVAVSADDNGSTPYLNAPELMPLDTIDAVVITHAHLDHSGLLPVLYKYGYDGPVYCTPPTRDLMSLLQVDYIKVAVGEAKKAPYESSHIRDAVVHCIPLKYGETTDISPDVRLTLQNAGHILGSSIAHFHIGDGLYNIAFTGDIKFERSWLFNASVNKFPRLETLVIESTYGGYHDMQPSGAARCSCLSSRSDVHRR
jgi:KH/beta-lactamase-domain protein